MMNGTKNAMENIRIQRYVVLVGILLFIIKMVAWYLTKSIAILSDALESTVNVAASLIGLYSLTLSAKPRDKEHPYGHGKVEFLSAGIEGTLITVAGLIIIYEAVYYLNHPRQMGSLDTGIALVGLSAIVNFGTGYLAVKKGKKNKSLALVASGKHLQSDTYTTIGIIAGLLLIYVTGLSWIDSAVALVFAFLIIFTGFRILRSSVAGIMDEADISLIKEVVNLLNQHRKDNWIDVHNLRIIKYGSFLHIDLHMTVPWYMNVIESHREVDAIDQLIKQEFGDEVESFVHTDPCKDFACRICSKKDCLVRKGEFEKRLEWTVDNISSNLRHRLSQEPGKEP